MRGAAPPQKLSSIKYPNKAKKSPLAGVVGLFPVEAHSGILLVAKPKLLIPTAKGLAPVSHDKPAFATTRGSGNNAFLPLHGLDSIS